MPRTRLAKAARGLTETARVRPPWTEPSPKRAFRALLACSSRAVRCRLGERLGELLPELGLALRLRAALLALLGLLGVRPRLPLHAGPGHGTEKWCSRCWLCLRLGIRCPAPV